ncbi:MAG: hypothetical protein GX577_00560 [Leptolinea sp.]|nr:hypothetical protein [Leptolinea sp.]
MNREKHKTVDKRDELENRTVIGQSILGGIFVVFALCMIVYFGRNQRLICNRLESGTVDCSGRVYFLNIIATSEIEMVQHVVSVQRKTSCQTHSETLETRCILNTVEISGKSGTIHVSQDFLNEETAMELLNKLKDFLEDNSQAHIEITSWNEAILLGGFLCAIPPFLIFGILFLFNRSVSLWIAGKGK